MPALIPHEGRGSERGLGRHPERLLGVETDLDPPLAGGAHRPQEERHAAGAESGGGDHVLLLHDERGADRPEQLRRPVEGPGVGGLRREARHRLAERDRRVGHGAHDCDIGSHVAADRRDRRPRDNGHKKMAASVHMRGNFDQYRVQGLWLDRDDHRVAGGHGARIVGRHREPPLREIRYPLRMAARDVDLGRSVRARGHEPLGDGAPDIPRAQDRSRFGVAHIQASSRVAEVWSAPVR